VVLLSNYVCMSSLQKKKKKSVILNVLISFLFIDYERNCMCILMFAKPN